MSAYRTSTTLTFWVATMAILVSVSIGQTKTPQAVSAASYVALRLRLIFSQLQAVAAKPPG